MALHRLTRRRTAALLGATALALGTLGAAAPAKAEFEFVFASGAVGGTFNVVATALVERLKDAYPGANADIVPGGSVSNSIRLGRGDLTVALIDTLVATRAYEGVTPPEQFEGGFPAIKAVGHIYDTHMHFVARADIGVDTIEELIEQRRPLRIVPGGPRGHVGVMAMQDILETLFDLDVDDMASWGSQVVYAEFADATQMLRDGQIDLFTPLTAAPNGSILDLASARDIKFLAMRPESLEKLRALGYGAAPMPANTYPGQSESVLVSATSAALYVHDDTGDELVRALTRTLLTSADTLKQAHRRLEEDFNAETAWQGVGNVPLHPAAQEVYEELGYMKAGG